MPRPPSEALEPALSRPTVDALIAVAAKGDQIAILRALRDSIAEAMGAAQPSEIASLSKQLRDTLAAIEAIKAPEVPSRADEVAAARAARLAGANVPTRTSRKVVGGTGSGRTGSKRGTGNGRGTGTRAPRSPRGTK